MNDKYRHEMKYVCNEMELAVINSRLSGLMKLDANTGAEGFYNIRSLYFDDYYNTCYYENEAGTDPREKFRIRIYNADNSRISLEIKRKEHSKTLKKSCSLTEWQCRMLMNGQLLPISSEYPPVLQKLCILMRTKRMKPSVIVDYDRVPYVCENGNVRVTIDRNISSSNDILSFLDKEIKKRPVMKSGQHVLEVKYDEFIPDYIVNNMELGSLRQTAFSKYYLCRKYSLGHNYYS